MKERKINWMRVLENRTYFLLIFILLVGLLMSLLSPYFFRLNSLVGMTRFGALLAMVALGETLIITSGGGGIDLSVGSMISLSTVVFGLVVQATGSIFLGAVVAVGSGALMGAFNGFNITVLKMPPLIATLGSLYAFGAIALVMTGGVPIAGFPDWFGFLGYGIVLGIPAQILMIVMPSFLVLWVLLNKTAFGRNVFLVGVNETSAVFAGISVRKTRFALYVISGILAALGGLFTTSWLMAARPDIGKDIELQAITVAVLGGANIFGGEGSLGGTILAVMIVTMVATGLQLANINTVWQLGAVGVILLASVSMNQWLAARKAG